MPIGVPELVIILVIVLLLFGAKRLPGLGRQLGSGMREFRDGISGRADGSGDESAEPQDRALEPAPPAEPAGTAAERPSGDRASTDA